MEATWFWNRQKTPTHIQLASCASCWNRALAQLFKHMWGIWKPQDATGGRTGSVIWGLLVFSFYTIVVKCYLFERETIFLMKKPGRRMEKLTLSLVCKFSLLYFMHLAEDSLTRNSLINIVNQKKSKESTYIMIQKQRWFWVKWFLSFPRTYQKHLEVATTALVATAFYLGTATSFFLYRLCYTGIWRGKVKGVFRKDGRRVASKKNLCYQLWNLSEGF